MPVVGGEPTTGSTVVAEQGRGVGGLEGVGTGEPERVGVPGGVPVALLVSDSVGGGVLEAEMPGGGVEVAEGACGASEMPRQSVKEQARARGVKVSVAVSYCMRKLPRPGCEALSAEE